MLILIAAAVYFATSTQTGFPWSSMMGQEGPIAPSSSNSWIISVGLIGAAAVIGVGLVVYFVLPKTPTTARNEVPGSPHVSNTLSTTQTRPLHQLEKTEETLRKLRVNKIKGRVTTGTARLDELLYGGIPPNFAVALTAPASDERHSIIKRFLETGAKAGDITFYVTISSNSARTLAEENPSNFYLFICNPQAETAIKKASNVFTLKGVGNLTEILIVLTQTIRKLDSSIQARRRICIDLISDALLTHHSLLTRRWLTELLTELNSNGFTTLAIVDPQMHSTTELHAILGLFDGEINLGEAQTETRSEKFIQIKRMSNQEFAKDAIVLAQD